MICFRQVTAFPTSTIFTEDMTCNYCMLDEIIMFSTFNFIAAMTDYLFFVKLVELRLIEIYPLLSKKQPKYLYLWGRLSITRSMMYHTINNLLFYLHMIVIDSSMQALNKNIEHSYVTQNDFFSSHIPIL